MYRVCEKNIPIFQIIITLVQGVELDFFKTCSSLASKSEFLHGMKSSLFSIEHIYCIEFDSYCIEFDVETNAVH